MVKLNVTGTHTFEWIATKYKRHRTYRNTCVKNFTEACFEGTDNVKDAYTVVLTAELQQGSRNGHESGQASYN